MNLQRLNLWAVDLEVKKDMNIDAYATLTIVVAS